MSLVAEKGDAGLLDIISNGYGGFMALVAITRDIEGCFAFMAGTTGEPFFHLSHGGAFVVRPCVKKLIVAVAAGVHAEMAVMVEAGIVSKQHLFDRMALTATLLYSKGGFVIMASTARPTFFHVCHGIASGSHACADDGIMAVTADK